MRSEILGFSRELSAAESAVDLVREAEMEDLAVDHFDIQAPEH